MKNKYKHQLKKKANTEASEKQGNNIGLGLKFKYGTISC